MKKALAIIRQAGLLALEFFGKASPLEKADRSFVTEADKAVEQLIRTELRRAFPGEAIMGEEEELEGAGVASRLWVIDPIDGTANFVASLPHWAVCIGLLQDGVPILGAVYFPVLNELYHAVRGGGAFLNETSIRARQDLIIRQDDLFGFTTLHRERLKIRVPCKARNVGAAVSCLTYVARGSYIGSVMTDVYLWDVAAGMVIAQESGAILHTLFGEPIQSFDLSGNLREPLPPMLICSEAMKGLLVGQISFD